MALLHVHTTPTFSSISSFHSSSSSLSRSTSPHVSLLHSSTIKTLQQDHALFSFSSPITKDGNFSFSTHPRRLLCEPPLGKSVREDYLVPQPHMRRHSKLMEFPHLSASHKELMVGIISALETRLQSELLPSSVVPPDVEYYQNQTGLSQGTLHIRRGLQSSHIDFMLASWLHLKQPNGGGAMNVTNLQIYLKPSTNVPHFQLELVQCSPSYMIFFLDLTPRKDLVLNPDYLKTFYEETQLDVYRQKLDQVPEIKPYFSSSLYFRNVVSPTGILVSIKCEDGDGGKDRCEVIIRENVSPIAYEVMRIWMDKYFYFVGESLSVSETERGEMEKRDGLIKRRAIDMDLSLMMPKQFGNEVGNRVLGFIKGVFNV